MSPNRIQFNRIFPTENTLIEPNKKDSLKITIQRSLPNVHII